MVKILLRMSAVLAFSVVLIGCNKIAGVPAGTKAGTQNLNSGSISGPSFFAFASNHDSFMFSTPYSVANGTIPSPFQTGGGLALSTPAYDMIKHPSKPWIYVATGGNTLQQLIMDQDGNFPLGIQRP